MATLKEIEDQLAQCDQQRMAAKAKASGLMKQRKAMIEQETLDAWGCTKEEYDAAKAQAEASKTPLPVVLNKLRQKRGKAPLNVQQAKTRL